jgi:hypothetical protein
VLTWLAVGLLAHGLAWAGVITLALGNLALPAVVSRLAGESRQQTVLVLAVAGATFVVAFVVLWIVELATHTGALG